MTLDEAKYVAPELHSGEVQYIVGHNLDCKIVTLHGDKKPFNAILNEEDVLSYRTYYKNRWEDTLG